MRKRDRDRVERRARQIASLICPTCAAQIKIIWARSLPDAFGYAWQNLIVFDEGRFVGEEGEDTLRHEVAHVLVFALHPNAKRSHGVEYRLMRNRLDREIKAWEEEE